MADKIPIQVDAAGLTLYAILRNAAGEVWNGSSFETYNNTNYATYDLPLVEQGGSGYYTVDMPSVPAGIYVVTVHEQAGGSPAQTDTPLSSGAIDWDGTNIVAHAVHDGPRLPSGTVQSGSTATSVNTNLAAPGDDHYKYMWFQLTSGTLNGQVRQCTGSTGTTNVVLAFSNGFTSAPANGVTIRGVNR